MTPELSIATIVARVNAAPSPEVCAWDDEPIVVGLSAGLEPVDDAIAGAVRDHQATIRHQAARRRLGIVDVAPAPNRRPPVWTL